MKKTHHDIKAYIASLELYRMTATLQLIDADGRPAYQHGLEIETIICRDPDERLTDAIANEIRGRIAGKDAVLVDVHTWGSHHESTWEWPAMYSEHMESPTWRLEVIAEKDED